MQGAELPKKIEGAPTPLPATTTEQPSTDKAGKIKDITRIIKNVSSELNKTTASQDQISQAMYQKMHSPEKAQSPEQIKKNLGEVTSQLKNAQAQLTQARAKIDTLADYKLERGKTALEDVQKLELQVKVLEKTMNSLQQLVDSPSFNDALKAQRSFFQDSTAVQASSKLGKDKASHIAGNCKTCVDKLEQLKAESTDEKVKEKITKMQHNVLAYAKSCLTQSQKQVETDYKLPFFSWKGASIVYAKKTDQENANKGITAQLSAIDVAKSALSVGPSDKAQRSVEVLLPKSIEANARAFFLKPHDIAKQEGGVEFHSSKLSSAIMHRNLTAQSHEIEGIGAKILQVESEIQKHLIDLENPKPLAKPQKDKEIADIENAIAYLEGELDKQKELLQERSSSSLKAELYGFIAQLEQKIDHLKIKLQVLNDTSQPEYSKYFEAEKKFTEALSSIAKPETPNKGSSLYKASTEFKEEAVKGKELENLSKSRSDTLESMLSTQCEALLALSKEELRLQNEILSGAANFDPKNPVQHNMLLSIAEKGMARQLLLSSPETDITTARLVHLLEHHQFTFPQNPKFSTLLKDYKTAIQYDTHLSLSLDAGKELSHILKNLRESSRENASGLLHEAHVKLEKIKDPSVKNEMMRELEQAQTLVFKSQLEPKGAQYSMKSLQALSDGLKPGAKSKISNEKIAQESRNITTALTTLMSHAVYSSDPKTKKEANAQAHELFQKLQSDPNLGEVHEAVLDKMKHTSPELFQKFAENYAFGSITQNIENQSLLIAIDKDYKTLTNPQNADVKTLAHKLNENHQKLMTLLKDQVPYASEVLTGAYLGIPTQDLIINAAKDHGVEDLSTQTPISYRNMVRIESRKRAASVIRQTIEIKKGEHLLSAITFHQAHEELSRLKELLQQNPGDPTLQSYVANAEKGIQNVRGSKKLQATSFFSTRAQALFERAKSTSNKQSIESRKELQANLSKHLSIVLYNSDQKKTATSKTEITKFLQALDSFPEARDAILYSDSTVLRMLHTAIRENKIESALIGDELVKIFDVQASLRKEIEKIQNLPASTSPEKLTQALKEAKERISAECSAKGIRPFAPYQFPPQKSDEEKTIQLLSYMIHFSGETRISMMEEKDTILGLFKDLSKEGGDPKIAQLRKIYTQFDLRPREHIDEMDVAKILFNTMSDFSNRSLPAVAELMEISKNLPISSQSTKEKLTSDLERLQKATQALRSGIAQSTGKEGLIVQLDARNSEIEKQANIIVEQKLVIEALGKSVEDSKKQHQDPAVLDKIQHEANAKIAEANAKIVNANKKTAALRTEMFELFRGTQKSVIPALAEHGKEYAEALSSVMSHFKEIDKELARKEEKATPQEKGAIGKYEQVKSKFNQMLTGSTKLQLAELLNNTPTSEKNLRGLLLQTHEVFEEAARS